MAGDALDRALAAGLAAASAFVSSGCELLYPVGDYAGRWCDTQPRTLAVCADFDDGKLVATPQLAHGSVVVDANRSTSPPFSVTATVPNLASGIVGNATLPIALPKGSTRVHCEFDLFVPGASNNTGAAQGFSFPLPDGTHYDIRFTVSGTTASLHAFTVDTNGKGTDQATWPIKAGLRADWNRVGIDVSAGSDAGPGTVSASFDGTGVLAPQPLMLTTPNPMATMEVMFGVLSFNGPKATEFGFDDIACSAE